MQKIKERTLFAEKNKPILYQITPEEFLAGANINYDEEIEILEKIQEWKAIKNLKKTNRWITKDMFNKKLKEYKERQAELNQEMQRYTDADENYYIVANTVLRLAQNALEIFKSSEVTEKRRILNFLLQNPALKGKKLEFKLKAPFDAVLKANNCSTMLREVDDIRTYFIGLKAHFEIPVLVFP